IRRRDGPGHARYLDALGKGVEAAPQRRPVARAGRPRRAGGRYTDRAETESAGRGDASRRESGRFGRVTRFAIPGRPRYSESPSRRPLLFSASRTSGSRESGLPGPNDRPVPIPGPFGEKANDEPVLARTPFGQ